MSSTDTSFSSPTYSLYTRVEENVLVRKLLNDTAQRQRYEDLVKKTVTDVLNNLTTLSGYIWSIDSSKQLRFVLPTDTNTPAELTVSNTLKGATVSQEFTDYCNGIYVLSKNGTTTYLETSGEVSTYKHWQKFINAPELEAAADATALCQKTLDRYGFVPKIVRLQTIACWGFIPASTG